MNSSQPQDTKPILEEFISTYLVSLFTRYGRDNVDPCGYPPPEKFTPRGMVRDAVDTCLSRLGLIRRATAVKTQGELANIIPHVLAAERLYAELDADSRGILLELLAYRVLGPKHVKLSLNDSCYRQMTQSLRLPGFNEAASTFRNSMSGDSLRLLDLNPLGRRIRCHGLPSGIQCEYLLRQYRCARGAVRVEVAPGDVVIDGGACWGETALNFADEAGENGRVVSFEFIPDNVNVFRANLELNPSLARRIRLVTNPLWDQVGINMNFTVHGPASKVSLDDSRSNLFAATSETIDHITSALELDRVDFIKLDVEGAELNALKGAEATIRRYRPKLAICIYHDIQDFWRIPDWIRSLSLGYRFAIGHFTIYAGETVLFCSV